MLSDRPADPSHLDVFVDAWKVASKRLLALKARDLRSVDVAACIEALTDAFDAALAAPTQSATSGLVAQQAVFARIRHEAPVPPGS